MKSDARPKGHPSIYRQQMADSDARFISIDEDTRQPLPEVDILANIEMAVVEDLKTPPLEDTAAPARPPAKLLDCLALPRGIEPLFQP